jgi:hypothetical protein
LKLKSLNYYAYFQWNKQGRSWPGYTPDGQKKSISSA